MKFVVVAVFLCVVAFVVADDGKQYDSKYDTIDLDEILQSKRLLSNYIKCLMGTGSCTPEGNELKEHIPDALKTDCSKCTETQKKGTEKVIRFLRKNNPKEWEELQVKYDPERVYTTKYAKELDATSS